jgi:cell division protein FtsB
MDHSCNQCNKIYKSYQSLWNHNKKFHNKNVVVCGVNEVVCGENEVVLNTTKNKYVCNNCNKIFNDRSNKYKHEKICKNKNNEINNENIKIKELMLQIKKQETKILQYKLKIQKTNSVDNQKKENNDNEKLKEENEKLKEELKSIKNNINNLPINNQLINIISNKNKKIEELMINNNQSTIQPIIEKQINTFESLTLNNIVITSRSEDNFINATQLCQAGGKLFSDWFRLNNSKQLINEAVSDMGIPISQLIDIKKGNSGEFFQGTWIHPDLAIQLAQWLSPKFAIQVSKWIRQLFTSGKIEITEKLLTENKLKDQEIKLLKDTYVRKHKREDYPDTNVIYIITTDDHLKNRTYIIGKAKNLKNRLSTYNKTCEHQVIYYKQCINEEILNLVESMTLNLLKKYQEKANRDRFILPVENDISLFINIIENCINFYDQYKQL